MTKEKSDGLKVIEFLERYALTPEGKDVGKPLKLEKFQKDFITQIYDNKKGTRRAILSLARKNGKTALIAGILMAHIIGPMRKQNSQVVSGAMSRDQAALVYHLAEKMLTMQPKFEGLYRVVPSQKRIVGLKSNVEYRALSADGHTAHGLSPILAILDEAGQVRGPMTPFIEAITTSQGAHDNPLLMIISTQAPSDADFLSLMIDDAQRSSDPHTVCHVYAADEDCDLMDKTQWKKANPALGLFRSAKDLEEQLKQASRIPTMEASVRNLLLNQRISLENIWVSPSLWKANSGAPDPELLKTGEVHLGLDLSRLDDLTACVASVRDDEGRVHVFPWVFTPMDTLEARQSRDRAPYLTWVSQEKLIAVPGKVLDYEWVSEYMAMQLEGCNIRSINFDRWRIEDFKRDADRYGFGADALWNEVGQGYKDFSPRMEKMQELLLQASILHGGHPLLNMAAANAIAVLDPAGNQKLAKDKSTQKIDPLVAMVMSVYAAAALDDFVDVDALIM
jgi:phage terminase large subunit-like protein